VAHESLTRHEEVLGPSNRSLGLTFAAVFVLIAVLPLAWGGHLRLWSIGIAVGFAVAALLAPGILGPLNRLWMRLGLLLHRVVSPLMLGIMFFVVIAPMGVVMRVLGKDPLRRRVDPDAASYWIHRRPPGPQPKDLPEQF
jgi:hypothetical protein